MEKNNSLKKFIGKVFMHLIEIAVLYILAIWIQKVAPSGYALPTIILFIAVYFVYLVSSIVDDYLDIQGADFIV